jgi:hypothetical protein
MQPMVEDRTLVGILFLLAGLSWTAVIFLFSYLARDVVRVAPPKTNHPLRSLLEATDVRRVWREHKKYFPRNVRRRAVAIFALTTAALIFAGKFISG